MSDVCETEVGLCAMFKKFNSKHMKEILKSIKKAPYIQLIIFDEKTILTQPVSDGPICDAFMSFYSHIFPLYKAIEYDNLRKLCEQYGTVKYCTMLRDVSEYSLAVESFNGMRLTIVSHDLRHTIVTKLADDEQELLIKNMNITLLVSWGQDLGPQSIFSQLRGIVYPKTTIISFNNSFIQPSGNIASISNMNTFSAYNPIFHQCTFNSLLEPNFKHEYMSASVSQDPYENSAAIASMQSRNISDIYAQQYHSTNNQNKDKYESQLDDLRKQLKQTKEELDKKTQAIATMKVKLIDKTAGAVSAAENQKSVAEARAKQMEVDKLNKDKEEINEKLKKSEEELALSRKEVGKLAKEMEDMKLLNVKKGNNPVNELPDWWNKYKV